MSGWAILWVALILGTVLLWGGLIARLARKAARLKALVEELIRRANA